MHAGSLGSPYTRKGLINRTTAALHSVKEALHSMPPLGSSEQPATARHGTSKTKPASLPASDPVDGVGLRHRCPGSVWCALPEGMLVAVHAKACCMLLLLLLLHAHQQC